MIFNELCPTDRTSVSPDAPWFSRRLANSRSNIERAHAAPVYTSSLDVYIVYGVDSATPRSSYRSMSIDIKRFFYSGARLLTGGGRRRRRRSGRRQKREN
ncbi:hypothetical protein EVAR_6410_1 [Eumeta japonica]|uniref:Uncharacterized protein n=1 Tax=Eumeta variegata TaxID=151549 RepID=A0A4C1TCK9_EUMVA|nr:hypothetical protein EVAR_6410_1 [Eumeta japonica]